jgi:nitroreductase
MEFYDVIETRRSIRGYLDKPVPEESIARISRAVQLAPTACNRQPFRLYLFRDPAIRSAICAKVPFPWLNEAPVVAVLAGNASAAWERPDGGSIIDVDASIVMEHFVLAATAEGLGTCWICAFRRDEMDKALGLEGSPWHSVAISPLGYAKAGSIGPFHRKNVQEMVQVID